jgi:hypothetical protein
VAYSRRKVSAVTSRRKISSAARRPCHLTSESFRASLHRFIGEKGGASSARRHEREECNEREEAHSENGCRRRVLHFCVAWEARLKMGNEDRYSVGDVLVSYSDVLVTRFAFLAIRWR